MNTGLHAVRTIVAHVIAALGCVGSVGCVVSVVGSSSMAHAQETVAAEVWLGSTLFTNEDIENLHEAATLTSEQRDAAVELMRGAMARARTMSLKFMRGMQDMEGDTGEDGADEVKTMQSWADKQKKQRDDVVAIEKEVMTDVRALLDTKQADEGWPRFERSRRRLLLRNVGGNGMFSQGFGDEDGEDSGQSAYLEMMQSPMVDVLSLVRSSKLSEKEKEEIASVIPQYESGIDALLGEWRPLGKRFAHGNMYFGYDPNPEQPSKDERAKMKDLTKRMKQLQVRVSRQIEDVLKGDTKDRFLRQRLKHESRYSWQSMKRLPQVTAVMKLRSLSPEQKKQVQALVEKAEASLLKYAVDDRHQADERILMEKKLTQEEMMQQWQGQDGKEKMKTMQKTSKQLVKDIMDVLTTAQKNAYETGFENEEDLRNAFEKRRAADAWQVDQDISPWADMWQDQEDER